MEKNATLRVLRSFYTQSLVYKQCISSRTIRPPPYWFTPIRSSQESTFSLATCRGLSVGVVCGNTHSNFGTARYRSFGTHWLTEKHVILKLSTCRNFLLIQSIYFSNLLSINRIWTWFYLTRIDVLYFIYFNFKSCLYTLQKRPISQLYY